jgi:hypothetical protein
LRLWAGCLDAAKYLRDKYANRGSDGTVIEEIILLTIDPKALLDSTYYTGIEAAPVLRKIRNQQIFSDGVPSDPPAMKHLNG